MDNPIRIPTTRESVDQNVTRFESALNQKVPQSDRSFVRVLAVIEGLAAQTSYKAAARAILDNLATTATRSGLERIGEEVDLSPNPAVAARLRITVDAAADTEIPANRDFIGDANGLRYRVDSEGSEDGGEIEVTVTATETGTSGNLEEGDELNIGSPIAGVGTAGTVVEVIRAGADEEDTEDFRDRVLDELRAQGGGGNPADYRRWGQEVEGVARVYPYRGEFDENGVIDPETAPPDRTVFVEASEDIDPDGVPGSGLLDQVRESITADPETERARQPLGLTDDTLFIRPIRRTDFYVTIDGLEVPEGFESGVQDDIEEALKTYFRSLRPFVEGLDAQDERRDVITRTSISRVVQQVVGAASGYVEEVRFEQGGFGNRSLYELGTGELAKLEEIEFV